MLAERKQYVGMILEVSAQGHATPKAILWPDGRQYAIDKVLCVTAAPIAVGGTMGQCYTCQIRSRQAKLYRELDRWFVESKTPVTR